MANTVTTILSLKKFSTLMKTTATKTTVSLLIKQTDVVFAKYILVTREPPWGPDIVPPPEIPNQPPDVPEFPDPLEPGRRGPDFPVPPPLDVPSPPPVPEWSPPHPDVVPPPIDPPPGGEPQPDIRPPPGTYF